VFKVCSSCGQEYQSWVTECSDCGVPLDLAPGETLAPAPRAVPGLAELVALRRGGPWELQALAEALQTHGISSRIDAKPPEQLTLYVGRADLAAAREIAAELAARDLPDAEAGVAHDPTACPACGEPTPENAATCSACGLEFPEVAAEEMA
jgi:ribosomal protein L37E